MSSRGGRSPSPSPKNSELPQRNDWKEKAEREGINRERINDGLLTASSELPPVRQTGDRRVMLELRIRLLDGHHGIGEACNGGKRRT